MGPFENIIWYFQYDVRITIIHLENLEYDLGGMITLAKKVSPQFLRTIDMYCGWLSL